MRNFCSQCGESLEMDSKFCGKCGASTLDVSNDQSSSNIENNLTQANKKAKLKKKKKSVGKIVVTIVFILIFLFILFIGVAIFLIKSTDTSLDISDFSGYYSGELWITEIVVNDEFINIVAEYHIEKVEKLLPIDSTESTNAINEALNEYFEKTLIKDTSLIEVDDAEISFIEKNQGQSLIPDEGLPSLNQNTLTGVWELDDGYEGTFIIFDKGEYYDSFSEWTYIWDNEGYALFYLDEDIEIVPYEIQANKVMIHYERYGNESECYIKHNDISHQLIFNSFDENIDSNTMVDNYSDVQIIEKDIPSNMNKELIFVIEAEVDEDSKTLNGLLHVDFINGNIVELKLKGSKVE